MAVINDPNVAANIAKVGNVAYVPFHALSGPFPIGSGGAYRIAAQTANMTAALASDSEVFQFRYVTAASRVCLIHGVAVSAGANLAATAAANVSLRMRVARSWTAAGSGGTRISVAGNNCKLRTSQATSEVNDIGVASTAALTTGTKTLDTEDIGSVVFGIGTGALTVAIPIPLVPKTNLFGDTFSPLGWPLVLANQEGFVIRNSVAMPATMTFRIGVDVLWSEVDSF